MPAPTPAESVAAHAFLGQLARDWPADSPRAGSALRVASGESYKGAQINRMNRAWQPDNVSGDAAIYDSWPTLTARIRDQARNEPILRKAVGTLTKLAIGTGIETYSSVLLAPDQLDDQHNAESDELFQRWGEDEADAEGRLAWPEMQRLHFREVVTTGESLLLRCADNTPGRTSPVCYQVLEAEQIDDSKSTPAGTEGNTIVRGLEFDRRGRVVAYWLFLDHPLDPWADSRGWQSQRVPAERVIHTFLQTRPSESRGVSWFASLMQTARDADWLVGNELTASALAALLTVVVKRKDGGTAGGTGFNPDGDQTDDAFNQLFKLGRGTVAQIGAEDEIEVVRTDRPNSGLAAFVQFLMQLAAMGCDISHMRLAGTHSPSYTAARAAHMDDDAHIKPLQRWFGRSVCKPVRRTVSASHAALGRFSTVGPILYRDQAHRYGRFTIQPAGREQLDPIKETKAAMDRIRAGLSDWETECALRGQHYRSIVLRQEQQRAFAAAHNVAFNLGSNPQSSAGGEAGGDDKEDTDAPLPSEADE
jgi:lambda family phage portal protein